MVLSATHHGCTATVVLLTFANEIDLFSALDLLSCPIFQFKDLFKMTWEEESI